MTKEEVFAEINKTQDEYVSELISLINSKDYSAMKTISFTSPTGTGKTKMMAKLINHFPEYYFIVTTLSKGQLNIQVQKNLEFDCSQINFYVYGSADYKINSILDSETILNRIPKDTKCIWLRDEGHIKTNRYEELLMNYCYKVINFSATNIHSDILCNFSHTMMLRTVNQNVGTPYDAIKKLLEIKKAHKYVKKYNPCAIIRCVGGKNEIYNEVITLCKKYKLKYINITEDPYVMEDLCEDDNEYDVIINKFKIVEGIDIRRAHVLYMDNQPSNNSTTIQAIGRCRRNALIYRDDIDIFADMNSELLEKTRECYVYYNVKTMKIDSDESGELYYAFCDHISCESLKANTRIFVNNGQLTNGLYVLELKGKTGWYYIEKDKETGFNVVCPETDFYSQVERKYENYIYVSGWLFSASKPYKKVLYKDISKFPICGSGYSIGIDSEGRLRVDIEKYKPYYSLMGKVKVYDKEGEVPNKIICLFSKLKTRIYEEIDSVEEISEIINEDGMYSRLSSYSIDDVLQYLRKSHLLIHINYDQRIIVSEKDIRSFFGNLHSLVNKIKNCSKSQIVKELIKDYIRYIEEKLSAGIIDCVEYSCMSLAKSITNEEQYMLEKNKSSIVRYSIYVDELKRHPQYVEYSKIINDRESAIIGVDYMQQVDIDYGKRVANNGNHQIEWVESRSVTSKVGQYNKLNNFISRKYKRELIKAKQQCFSGKNDLGLEKKCNTMIGYCVEYYSKYILYGRDYLETQFDKDRVYAQTPKEYEIVHACMLKYKELMAIAFGVSNRTLWAEENADCFRRLCS